MTLYIFFSLKLSQGPSIFICLVNNEFPPKFQPLMLIPIMMGVPLSEQNVVPFNSFTYFAIKFNIISRNQWLLFVLVIYSLISWPAGVFFSQVFCDNYLDGGYHVPYAHKGLASGLELNSYSTSVCSLTSSYLSLILYFTFATCITLASSNLEGCHEVPCRTRLMS